MSESNPLHPTLTLPPIILGGSGFSDQSHPNPQTLPVATIIRRAFDEGILAIDTSPYYHPSEHLLGTALSDPQITTRYARSDYILMTKVGRLSTSAFDYSPTWVRQSVHNSLERLHTTYLDVVFCHDVEFVSEHEAVEAVGVLFDLRRQGYIKYVGISGYPLETLVSVAHAVRHVYGQPLDVVQTWAQLTLQNTKLERYGIPALREAGVSVVCNSSPLASGLLRAGKVPCGRLGDWHPAPEGLRSAVTVRAADRYAVSVSTVLGVSSLKDVEEDVEVARDILRDLDAGLVYKRMEVMGGLSRLRRVNEEVECRDLRLCYGVRNILGEWAEYDLQK
ncbi:Glycosyl hydrolases 2 family protein [Aspergillus niger]|uniref:Glycosyl hydrolases 2 family protein n=1 Tax=Aspergillus niger TaxID=5061 RepID=A0A505HYH5_ASPNG|nr:Glycosyl hydrolases 2 family protein [Aspergillus niger]